MNKRNTIIIKGSHDVFFDGLDDTVYSYYTSYGLFMRGVRKILRKLGLHKVCSVFYGNWKKHLMGIKLIILFENGIEDLDEIASYIKSVNHGVRIVLWCWNPVRAKDILLNSKCVVEIWTYNRFDAKKYGLIYNPQFYRFMSVLSDGLKTDMIFLGKDKGRRQIVLELVRVAEAQNLKCDITLVDGRNDTMKYRDYLERMIVSRCVVDVVPNQKCGLTLRPLEALFYKKKLVTNYEDIVNYDFYDGENIFILGKDDINKLADFVNSPYKEIDKKIVDFYSYGRWLERIEKGESVKYE